MVPGGLLHFPLPGFSPVKHRWNRNSKLCCMGGLKAQTHRAIYFLWKTSQWELNSFRPLNIFFVVQGLAGCCRSQGDIRNPHIHLQAPTSITQLHPSQLQSCAWQDTSSDKVRQIWILAPTSSLENKSFLGKVSFPVQTNFLLMVLILFSYLFLLQASFTDRSWADSCSRSGSEFSGGDEVGIDSKCCWNDVIHSFCNSLQVCCRH